MVYVNSWWGQFGQNGLKLYENGKIGIFGPKLEGHQGASQFFG